MKHFRRIDDHRIVYAPDPDDLPDFEADDGWEEVRVSLPKEDDPEVSPGETSENHEVARLRQERDDARVEVERLNRWINRFRLRLEGIQTVSTYYFFSGHKFSSEESQEPVNSSSPPTEMEEAAATALMESWPMPDNEDAAFETALRAAKTMLSVVGPQIASDALMDAADDWKENPDRVHTRLLIDALNARNWLRRRASEILKGGH